MSSWIVWSKPSPWKVIARGCVVAIIVIVPITLLVEWLHLGYLRYVATPIGVIAGMYYMQTHRPPAPPPPAPQ